MPDGADRSGGRHGANVLAWPYPCPPSGVTHPTACARAWKGRQAALTHKQLAVELQAHMPVLGGHVRPGREQVHLQPGLLRVPFSPDEVPPVVIEGGGRLHCDLAGPVPHIEGKGHFHWGWKHDTWGGWRRFPDGPQGHREAGPPPTTGGRVSFQVDQRAKVCCTWENDF